MLNLELKLRGLFRFRDCGFVLPLYNSSRSPDRFRCKRKRKQKMNWITFLLPLLEQIVQTVGPTVLNEVNKLIGDLATKHNVSLDVTPAHKQ